VGVSVGGAAGPDPGGTIALARESVVDAIAASSRALSSEEALAELDAIEAPVTAYNTLVADAEKLTSAEYDYRGGKPSEPRREVSRKTVAEFWAYANNGAEVPEKFLGQIRETASGNRHLGDRGLRRHGSDVR
jgi:hypothetical protein